MSVKKTETKDIHVHLQSSERGFEKALDRAIREANRIHGVDYSGHSKHKDFPRSRSSVRIEFVGMDISYGMCGITYNYEFKTWMEAYEEEDED